MAITTEGNKQAGQEIMQVSNQERWTAQRESETWHGSENKDVYVRLVHHKEIDKQGRKKAEYISRDRRLAK